VPVRGELPTTTWVNRGRRASPSPAAESAAYGEPEGPVEGEQRMRLKKIRLDRRRGLPSS